LGDVRGEGHRASQALEVVSGRPFDAGSTCAVRRVWSPFGRVLRAFRQAAKLVPLAAARASEGCRDGAWLTQAQALIRG
jgi:hypothetical protein